MTSRRGYFLSDLHLFSNRSYGDVWIDSLAERLENAHTLVLGGDIFDLKWSCMKDLATTIAAAMDWLKRLIDRYPTCAFYYLLGNHDAHPDFVAALDRLAFNEPRLEWQPYYVRLEHCVFLHGDVVDGGHDHAEIEARRHKHRSSSMPKAYHHWFYDVAVQLQLHRAVATVARRHAWVLQRLSRYLSDQGLDANSGIEHIYFGHTHRALSGVVYDRLCFHNGGAPIRGLKVQLVETALQYQDTNGRTR